jgi:hypothetical protein
MDATNTPVSDKPRRQRLGYSLRTLLLVFTLLCVWLGMKMNAAQRQAEAVAAIFKAGGTVNFDYQMVPAKSGPLVEFEFDPDARPSAPEWLRKLFGEDFFRTVVAARLTGKNEIPSSDLAQLTKLSGIKLLCLTVEKNNYDPNIWPRADDELAVLGTLSNLQYLALTSVQINGPRLAYLAPLEHLQTLELQSMTVNGTALAQICKISSLKNLHLLVCEIEDGADLKDLRGLSNLEMLFFFGTRISDAGLQAMKQLANLKTIALVANGVTEEQSRDLQNSMPNVSIRWIAPRFCNGSVTRAP